ncbi:MAG: hypothetical protein WD826_00270, partial [Actinomycetota bacterium]
MSKSTQAWLGELVGTFAFITIGAGVVILSSSQLTDIGLVGVALGLGAQLAHELVQDAAPE